MKTKTVTTIIICVSLIGFFVAGAQPAQAGFFSATGGFLNKFIEKIQKISVDLGKIFASEEEWTYCANENGRCEFLGTNEVRFGAEGQFTSAFFTDGVDCNSEAFGDPAPGIFKSCSYRDSAIQIETTTTVAPTILAPTTTTPTPTTTSSSNSFPKVRADFNGVLTHPNFWARNGEQNMGKRYLGTMSNAGKYGSQFMKFWSAPLKGNEKGSRQVVFHKYFGWDDEPSVIYEWENYQRDPGNVLKGYKYGGDVINTTPPFWLDGWMNRSYRPEFTRRSYEHYSCDSGTPVYGYTWPNLSAGQHMAVSKLGQSSTTCYPKNDGNTDYVAVVFNEDFGDPYSAVRKDKCQQEIPPVWGTDSNAYNICLDAPNVGKFEQRHAYYVQPANDWHYGCEPLVYVWGYPEEGPTNQWFRNGELKWAEFGRFSASKTHYKPDDDTFWNNGCKAVMNDSAAKGGWIYSGVYQYGLNFYNDKGGTTSSAALISRLNPEPEPTMTTDTWSETLGFKGEAWCAVETTCDTGWVTGPAVKVECSSDRKLINQGTLYSKWSGLKKFIGNTYCDSPVPTTTTPTPTTTSITIRAKGTPALGQYPTMHLRQGDTTFQSWSVTGEYKNYTYAATSNLTANKLKILFLNDFFNPYTKEDRNLTVDYIKINSTTYQSESPQTFASGYWTPATGCASGYLKTETLHCNGYFEYDITQPVSDSDGYFGANLWEPFKNWLSK